MDLLLHAFDPATSSVLALTATLFLQLLILLLLVLTADQWLARRHATVVRAAVWNAAILIALFLPLGPVLLPDLQVACLPAELAGSSPPANNASANRGAVEFISVREPQNPAAFGLLDWGVVLYLAGVSLLAGRLILSLFAMRWLARSAEDGPAARRTQWATRLAGWQAELRIRRPVHLAMCERVRVPVVIGGRQPLILIPPRLFASASRREQDAVLIHELSHIRRNDDRWQLLLRIAQAIYWCHPFVWCAGWRLADLREQACDQVCVHRLGGRRLYQELLLNVAERLRGRPPEALAIAMVRRSRLERRLQSIESGAVAEDSVPQPAVRFMVAALTLIAAAGPASVVLTPRTAKAAAPHPVAPDHVDPQSPPETTAAPPWYPGGHHGTAGEVGRLFITGLREADWSEVDRLVAGVLAQRTPRDWAAFRARMTQSFGPRLEKLHGEAQVEGDSRTAVFRLPAAGGGSVPALMLRLEAYEKGVWCVIEIQTATQVEGQ